MTLFSGYACNKLNLIFTQNFMFIYKSFLPTEIFQKQTFAIARERNAASAYYNVRLCFDDFFKNNNYMYK